ncbi:MAG TPA: hypothetical protein VJT75_12105 [Thermoleophilaceae bacterium]|nr:hypothetical protein [Thermoleophilaceae bacterium]
MLRFLLQSRAVTALVSSVAAVAAVTGAYRLSTDVNTINLDPAEVRVAVKDYETAITHGDGETACHRLTEAAKQELLAAASRAGLGADCSSVARSTASQADALVARAPTPERARERRNAIDVPHVGAVSIDGDTATARVHGVSDHVVMLVRTPAGWRVSGFTGPGG